MRKYLKLTMAILLCMLAGAVGAIFTASSVITWYSTLNKPPLTPPNWVFGPAWTTLYVLMGIALWMIWSKGINKKTIPALQPFGAQLALNALWSIAFFGLQNPLYGLLTIMPLWLLIAYTILKFRKLDKTAAYLLVPYLAWVTFATYLNLGVLLLN